MNAPLSLEYITMRGRRALGKSICLICVLWTNKHSRVRALKRLYKTLWNSYLFDGKFRYKLQTLSKSEQECYLCVHEKFIVRVPYFLT